MFSPAGPSAFESSVAVRVRSSTPSGTLVRSIGMTVPSASSGPPVYAGNSVTLRPVTRLGETTAALSSAGSCTDESVIVMSTRTLSPSGVILLIVPIATPFICTALSSNSADALLKYAVSVRPLPILPTCHTPAATSTAITPTSATMVSCRLSLAQELTRDHIRPG